MVLEPSVAFRPIWRNTPGHPVVCYLGGFIEGCTHSPQGTWIIFIILSTNKFGDPKVAELDDWVERPLLTFKLCHTAINFARCSIEGLLIPKKNIIRFDIEMDNPVVYRVVIRPWKLFWISRKLGLSKDCQGKTVEYMPQEGFRKILLPCTISIN
ncbi:MAG: hypothetical protein Q9198_010032 [Flavoplaca austrocitrina]